MKKLLLLATIASSTAFAGSISLDTRVDSDSATYNTANGGKNNSKFYLQTGRVDYKGKATDDLSFRLRLRFNKTQSAVNTRDSLNDSVDYASITHKMGDYALTAGKFDIMTAGFEGATAGSDMYFTSLAYGSLTRYATGANLAYTFGDNTVNAMVLNNKSDTTSGQTRNMYALVYKGALMDKALNLIASYHMLATPYTENSEIKNHNDSYVTLGAQYKLTGMAFSLDYTLNTLADTAGNKDKTESIILNGSYDLNEMSAVKAKIESSTYKDASTNTESKETTLGYGIAYEIKPIKDADFRYHVAYTNKDVKPETGDTKTESHIIAGLKLQADFLK